MGRSQSKNHNIELIKFLCLVTMIKNVYLRMDTVGSHIFINLLVNHTENNFVKYRQFILILSLEKIAISLTIYFD